MRYIKNFAAQGDLLLRKVNKPVPPKTTKVETPGIVVLAHSETGHHHAIPAQTPVSLWATPGNPMLSYLRIEADGPVDVEHHRPFDTHETLQLHGVKGDVWEIRRQREQTPDGWRMVAD
jgi:hypothetical protein